MTQNVLLQLINVFPGGYDYVFSAFEFSLGLSCILPTWVTVIKSDTDACLKEKKGKIGWVTKNVPGLAKMDFITA